MVTESLKLFLAICVWVASRERRKKFFETETDQKLKLKKVYTV